MIFFAQISNLVLAAIPSVAAANLENGWSQEQLQAVVIMFALGGLVVLLSAINATLQIIRHFRPSPAHHQQYATKAELRSLKEDVQDEFRGLKQSNDSNFKEMFETLRNVERSLGRLEGKSTH